MKNSFFLFFFINFTTNILFGQNECNNKLEIKQLGIEFCLPDKDWAIEEEDGLKFISLHKSTLYSGTKTYTLRMEKLANDFSAKEYFEKQLADYSNGEDYKEKLISKGIKEINGKTFYYGKTQSTYKSNNTVKNSYDMTYYYSENKIGYILSLVVSDVNTDCWNETETLKIWGTFKILSLPENSILE